MVDVHSWPRATAACAATATAAALCYCQARARRSARRCLQREVLAGVDAVRDVYDLSHRGFLPASCLLELPPAFAAWEDVVRRLPELNRQGLLRQAVDNMEAVSLSHLAEAKPCELRRAYLILGMLAHAYAHAHEVPWHLLGGTPCTESADSPAVSLPSQLAQPWFEVCCRLQMPPVLTAGATDLWNWRMVDVKRGVTLGNIKLTSSLTGMTTEENFHLIPCAMQAAAADVIPKVFQADILVSRCLDLDLAALLRELTDVLQEFKRIFSFVGDGVDVSEFYDIYRPLLNGFYPDGVVLEGVDMTTASSLAIANATPEGPKSVRVKSKGPSAGQSTMILLFDIFLGVSHEKCGAEFQEEMLTYMPEKHRRMVCDYRDRWKSTMPVREHVRRPGCPGLLTYAYDCCVSALRDLRRYHLATVTRYLTRTNTGTGASTWSIMLKEALQSTGNCLGSCPHGAG